MWKRRSKLAVQVKEKVLTQKTKISVQRSLIDPFAIFFVSKETKQKCTDAYYHKNDN